MSHNRRRCCWRIENGGLGQAKADRAAAGFVLDGESNLLQRSDDLHDKHVFDPEIGSQTDCFLLKFKRP